MSKKDCFAGTSKKPLVFTVYIGYTLCSTVLHHLPKVHFIILTLLPLNETNSLLLKF